jgi:hypothetical protein
MAAKADIPPAKPATAPKAATDPLKTSHPPECSITELSAARAAGLAADDSFEAPSDVRTDAATFP